MPLVLIHTYVFTFMRVHEMIFACVYVIICICVCYMNDSHIMRQSFRSDFAHNAWCGHQVHLPNSRVLCVDLIRKSIKRFCLLFLDMFF